MSNLKTRFNDFEEMDKPSQVAVIDTQTLQQFIYHAIKSALENNEQEKSKNDNLNPIQDELLTMIEVTKLLSVSKVTIHNWKKKGIIKSHKMGRKLYFKKVEILEAIKRQKYSF